MGKNLGANEGDIGGADSVCSQSRSGDADIGNRLMDKGGEQSEREMNGEQHGRVCTNTVAVNRQPMGICCMTRGIHTGVL